MILTAESISNIILMSHLQGQKVNFKVQNAKMCFLTKKQVEQV